VAAEHRHPAVERLASALEAVLGPATVRMNQPLARHSTLRIGGPADLLAVAGDADVLSRIVTMAWDYGVPCRVLGGGSNVLVSDAGVRGLVVLNRAQAVAFWSEPQAAGVRAESGASFSTLAQRCVTHGLAGLEWAVGIPGTVGGAVVGNAGAWGGDVASTLVRATVLEPGGIVAEWPIERFAYGYRTSALRQQAPAAGLGSVAAGSKQQAVVLEAQFGLQVAEHEALETQVADITVRRRASQPAGATCGSVFKNPPGDYAGRLIEAAGLKGRRNGGAQISPTHANFIVNFSNATAADVKALINLSQHAVQSQFGVALDLEIELIGDWYR